MAKRKILVEVMVQASIEIDEDILAEDAEAAEVSIPFKLDDESIAQHFANGLEEASKQYDPWDWQPFRAEGYCIGTLSMTPKVIEGS